MMAPSNSVPLPVLMVVGEKAFQMIVSQMFVAMNNEIPDPRPYLLFFRQDATEHRENVWIQETSFSLTARCSGYV